MPVAAAAVGGPRVIASPVLGLVILMVFDLLGKESSGEGMTDEEGTVPVGTNSFALALKRVMATS